MPHYFFAFIIARNGGKSPPSVCRLQDCRRKSSDRDRHNLHGTPAEEHAERRCFQGGAHRNCFSARRPGSGCIRRCVLGDQHQPGSTIRKSRAHACRANGHPAHFASHRQQVGQPAPETLGQFPAPLRRGRQSHWRPQYVAECSGGDGVQACGRWAHPGAASGQASLQIETTRAVRTPNDPDQLGTRAQVPAAEAGSTGLTLPLAQPQRPPRPIRARHSLRRRLPGAVRRPPSGS